MPRSRPISDPQTLVARLEQALHGRMLTEAPTWELWAGKIAMPLLREAIDALRTPAMEAQVALVGCERLSDGRLNIHTDAETCDVCRTPASDRGPQREERKP